MPQLFLQVVICVATATSPTAFDYAVEDQGCGFKIVYFEEDVTNWEPQTWPVVVAYNYRDHYQPTIKNTKQLDSALTMANLGACAYGVRFHLRQMDCFSSVFQAL